MALKKTLTASAKNGGDVEEAIKWSKNGGEMEDVSARIASDQIPALSKAQRKSGSDTEWHDPKSFDQSSKDTYRVYLN